MHKPTTLTFIHHLRPVAGAIYLAAGVTCCVACLTGGIDVIVAF